MLPLSSGSELPIHSLVFPMRDFSQVGEARRYAGVLTRRLEFDETRDGRVGIVVNELGNNLVKYAKDGQLILRTLAGEGRAGLEILSVDRGPGLDDSKVFQDGFTTGSTPGTGLGAVRRLADEFDLFSRPSGTVVMTRLYASDEAAEAEATYDVGALCVPYDGENVAGDAWAVRARGPELDAIMVDGLGHGPAAHKAAREAVDVFENSDAPTPDRLMQQVHGRLKSTRGGAVFLLNARLGAVDFLGAGNIRATLERGGESKTLISQNGTAGLQIRNHPSMSVPWDGNGDLILHSDGLNGRWDLSTYPGLQARHPSIIAAILHRDFSRHSDDATVTVIRRRP